MGAGNGRFFEDFRQGEKLQHATPRTLDDGDAALYIALTGDRNPLYCSDEFARAVGLPRRPLHDLLVFNIVLGRSAPDIAPNAVASIGYAEVRFLRPVFAGDTLRATSTVLGLREASSGAAGILWLRTTGYNQREQPVLSFIHWLMMAKGDSSANCEDTSTPHTDRVVPANALAIPERLRIRDDYQAWATGGRFLEDYRPGERIDHMDGITVEPAEHSLATRLYQIPSRQHGNGHDAARSVSGGRRPVNGGHLISVARTLGYNGLENALCCLAWDASAHVNPVAEGDTIYAWSEVIEVLDLANRDDAGALRLRLVALKNLPASGRESPPFPLRRLDEKTGRESYHPNVVLDLEHILLMPRRAAALA